MKAYVVMTYYGPYEGWGITGETDGFDEAVKIREEQMGLGNSQVVIFRPVTLEIKESNKL